MIHFTCPRCNAEYQYPDDMAGNKIRCAGPNCNQKLLVPPPAVLTAPAAAVAPGLPQWVNDQLTAPAAPAAPIMPAAPSARLWNYLENGRAKGPVAASELRRLVADGRLKPRDAVWSAGMNEWRPMHEALPEMFRKPAAAVRPRPPSAAKGADDDKRWGVFEKLGVGVFAVVAAVILGGLFALLVFPLIRSSATHVKPDAPADPGGKMPLVGGGLEQPAKGGDPELPPLGTRQAYQRVLNSCAWIFASDGHKIWTGTGSLIDREQRLVLTNEHVANETCKEFLVMFPAYDDEKKLITGRPYYLHHIKTMGIAAHLVKPDRTRDLAVIQLDALPDGAVPIRLARETVSPGQEICCIGGSPAGNDQGMWILSEGQVRQVYRLQWQYEDGFPREADIIASNLGTNHGDSGGPIYDDRGRLVGVNAMGETDSNQNVKHIDIREVLQFLPNCYRELGKAWKGPE